MGTQEGFIAEYYELLDGSYPAYDFINSLPAKLAAKTSWTILLLEEHGSSLRMPYSRHLEDGIFELRVIQGNNIARVLYFFVTGKRVILTNGFVKDTSKTPRAEIEKAKKYRDDYYMHNPKE